jgi:hypothetical protein
MAKTNFQYEKRQRELEKKKKAEQKAEEKARRKLEAKNHPGGEQQADMAGYDTPEDEGADQQPGPP